MKGRNHILFKRRNIFLFGRGWKSKLQTKVLLNLLPSCAYNKLSSSTDVKELQFLRATVSQVHSFSCKFIAGSNDRRISKEKKKEAHRLWGTSFEGVWIYAVSFNRVYKQNTSWFTFFFFLFSFNPS